MKFTWITIDRSDFEHLAKQGIAAAMLDQIENADLSSGEIVVIGRGDEAKSKALELSARGIAQSRLSYVDLQTGDNLFVRIERPKHLHWDDVVTLRELPDEKDFPVYKTGLDYLDKNLGWRWRIPELGVIAGAYACGKSTVTQMLAAGFANGAGRELGSGAMLCSWEDAAAEVKRNFAAYGDGVNAPDMLDRVSFVRRHPDDDRLISWYMDLVAYHKERYGTRFFVLDPWNEMDHQKDARQSETDYIRDMMKAFRRMVDRLQIILIVATHVPAKIIKGNGDIEPFKIGHAFGSVQFANKADRGICVVRSKKFDKTDGHTIIRLDKSKIERRMGRRGTVALTLQQRYFQFNLDSAATAEIKDVWKD
jgi:archaellum biogenesis ATPase FlaH